MRFEALILFGLMLYPQTGCSKATPLDTAVVSFEIQQEIKAAERFSKKIELGKTKIKGHEIVLSNACQKNRSGCLCPPGFRSSHYQGPDHRTFQECIPARCSPGKYLMKISTKKLSQGYRCVEVVEKSMAMSQKSERRKVRVAPKSKK